MDNDGLFDFYSVILTTDGLSAARMECYYAYWIWKTSMEPVPSPGVDPLEVINNSRRKQV